MSKLQVFVGYDPRGATGHKVTVDSMKDCSRGSIDVTPVDMKQLMLAGVYYRPAFVCGTGQMIDPIDGAPFSTEFSFTRFLVPYIANYSYSPAVFVDGDFLFYDDICSMVEKYFYSSTESPPVFCVRRESQECTDQTKMYGYTQAPLDKKNWSSLMIFNPSRCRKLTPDRVSTASGKYLHRFEWASSVGSIGNEWNRLYGIDDCDSASAVHFTLGTPDMPNATVKADKHTATWFKYADA